MTFVSPWGKSRRFNYFSRHFAFVSEQKSFWLSRKFFSVSKNAENRDIFASYWSDDHFLLTRNRLSLREFSGLSENARPFFLFSAIQSFMAGFFCILILPKEPQAFTAQIPWNREQIENAKFSIFRCVLHRSAQNSLFIKVGGLLCSFIL